jgi:hypothetical protein
MENIRQEWINPAESFAPSGSLYILIGQEKQKKEYTFVSFFYIYRPI